MASEPSATLGDVARLVDARAASASDAGVKTYVGLEHIPPLARRVAEVRGDPADFKAAVSLFSPGDVLFGKLRPYLRKVALADFEGACSTEILVLRPRDGRVSSEFLFHLLSSQRVADYAVQRSAGTRMPRVAPRLLMEMPIDVPPPGEQLRITHVLDAMEDVVEGAHRAEAEAEALFKSLRERLGELDSDEVTLGDVVVKDGIRIGPFGSQLHAYDYSEIGTPVVMPKDMIRGRISTESIARVGEEHVARLAQHKVEAGDILLPRRGDLTKRALVGNAEAGWLCGTGSIRIRVPGNLSRLVFEALSTNAVDDWLAANAVGTTMPNLNTEIVSRIPVRVPDLEEATPFVRALEALEATLVQSRTHRSAAREFREALRSHLLASHGHDVANEHSPSEDPNLVTA